MIDVAKVKSTHTRRDAIVYIRQSHPSQIENNRESTARQYALVEKAMALGWSKNQVTTIDEDLGVSGKVFVKRAGFDHLNAEVALGQVGILLGLEVSRLARSNADWYRLLDMCAITDTLLADSDGVYHPALFNDRLILGLKGTMSEAELHILRGRLDGGIRNKAARGELRRALPVGLVWGEKEGEIGFHPDEAVTGALRTIFDKFTELGSARQVWLWFRSQHLSFPLHPLGLVPSLATCHQLRWVAPTYISIYNVLSNPVYAGAYVYGKTRNERYVDEQGTVRKRVRHLPREEWSVFLPRHHEGFIDWTTFETIQARLHSNIRAELHQAGRALREGSALLTTARPGCLWQLRSPTTHRLSRHEHHTPILLLRQGGQRWARRPMPQRGGDRHRPSGQPCFSRSAYPCGTRGDNPRCPTTGIPSRRRIVSVASASRACPLRGRPRRAAISGGGPGKQTCRAWPRKSMGNAAAESCQGGG